MAVEVRFATDPADQADGIRTVGTAFLDRPDDENVEWRRSLSPDWRRIVAVDDGVVCGTASSFDTPLTLPGGSTVTMAAVSSVGVLPTHRRRGHLSRMMELQLGDHMERGDLVAGLVAAEWPIYGRYGYGPAIWAATYEIDKRIVRFRDNEWHGTIELADVDTMRKEAPAVFDAHRVETVGAIGRDDAWWDSTFGVTPRPGWKDKGNRFRALHRDPSGSIDGYATYSADGNWERNIPSSQIQIGEIVTTTAGAYADLWHYVLELDWTASAKAGPRPVDEVLPLLLDDGRAVTETHRGDHIWLRVLDVAGFLSARRYRCDATVVLEVVDEMLGRGGRYRLEGGPGGAACVAAPASAPDLTMPAATLGAICIGGTPLSMLAAAGLVDEHTPGAVGRADALFGWTPAPWCSTGF